MSGTVIAGIIIALMFLVSFSQWFYHIVSGFNVLIVNDIFVYYRIASWSATAVGFMVGVFWVLSLVNECPLGGPREGIFRYLNCDVYFRSQALLKKTGLLAPPTEQPTGNQSL